MTGTPRPIRFASGTLREHRHICAFFNSPEEEHSVLRPFITEGIAAGEKALHIVDPARRADHLRRLTDDGVVVSDALASGQLEVRPWVEAHLRGGHFRQDAMLDLVEELLQANAVKYPLTRLIAHMEWALLDKPGVEDLLEYESRVNLTLARYDDAVICTYDLTRFSASIVVDVLRTHPMVIVGGLLQENPYYVPPADYLRELGFRKRASQRTSIGSA
jgi:hypothetical protein